MPEDPLCPTCSSLMLFREGKFGDFWGCSKYPDCKGTRDGSGLDKAPDTKSQKKARKTDKEKIKYLTEKANYWSSKYFDNMQWWMARVNKIWPDFIKDFEMPDCQKHVCPCCGHKLAAHLKENGPELFNLFKERCK